MTEARQQQIGDFLVAPRDAKAPQTLWATEDARLKVVVEPSARQPQPKNRGFQDSWMGDVIFVICSPSSQNLRARAGVTASAGGSASIADLAFLPPLLATALAKR